MSGTKPFEATNIGESVYQTYAEARPYQWVRETYFNAIEAGATRVEYGLEWQGVQATGVYRRMIADDGCGMSAEELIEFFNTIGATGKQIGGAHENFGIGGKVSLVPWNTAGMIVLSRKDGDESGIWIWADPDTGQYGLRYFNIPDEDGDPVPELVWAPGWDDDLQIDLSQVWPPWIKDHGTVIILLGDSLDQDTIRNDPRREKRSPGKAVELAFRERFLEIPEGVHVNDVQIVAADRGQWPESPDSPQFDRSGEKRQRLWQKNRRVHGAGPVVIRAGAEQDTMTLSDGTVLRWWINPDSKDWQDRQPFIAALHHGELWNLTRSEYRYKNQFGIGFRTIRTRVGIIVEPPPSSSDRTGGVFANRPRTELVWNHDDDNKPLPWGRWGAEFVEHMPTPIRALIDDEIKGGTFTNEEQVSRLAMLVDRFKMKLFAYKRDDKGEDMTTPTKGRAEDGEREHGRGKRSKRRRARPYGEGDVYGDSPGGDTKATKLRKTAALPEWIPSDDVPKGMIASYVPHPPPGVVKLDVNHPIIESQVEFWAQRYPTQRDGVRQEVVNIYGLTLVASVAHSAQLAKVGVPSDVIKDKVRSDEALTATALGLWLQDNEIAKVLRDKFGNPVRLKAA